MRNLLWLWLIVCSFCGPAVAPASEGGAVTKGEALALMRTVPAREKLPDGPGYRWDRVGHADEVAESVSLAAPTRYWAGRMVVYAIFESGLKTDAVGDGGKSLGTWQLSSKVVSREVAFDPARAAGVWLRMAQASEAKCKESPPELRLAALASGDCHVALAKVSARERVVARAIDAVFGGSAEGAEARSDSP